MLRRPFEFTQYASREYQELLASHALLSSMSRRANCWDNAVAESFFATLECELLNQRRFKTQVEARMALFDFIEGLCEVHGENVAKLMSVPEEGRRIEG